MSWLFVATQFLLYMEYLQPGDMLWNRNPKYLYKKKFFYQSYCHICHTHINLLIYNGLMVAIDHISVITLLSPIATLQVCQNRHNQLIFRCFLFAFCFFYSLGAWCIDWTKRGFLRSIKPFFRLFITKNGSEAYFRFKKGSFELQKSLTW